MVVKRGNRDGIAGFVSGLVLLLMVVVVVAAVNDDAEDADKGAISEVATATSSVVELVLIPFIMFLQTSSRFNRFDDH